MMVGAILTQNTAWTNVEKAIRSLKSQGLIDPLRLTEARQEKIEQLIRSTGYFRQKTERLINMSRAIVSRWNGDLTELFGQPLTQARGDLLSLKGLGPETADSILLYAGDKQVFVVDAYTHRICERVGLIRKKDYDGVQKFFEANLPVDTGIYKEYHALLVALGKSYCLSSLEKAKCPECPLEAECETGLLAKV